MGVIHVQYSFPYFGALHIAIIWWKKVWFFFFLILQYLFYYLGGQAKQVSFTFSITFKNWFSK